jgi:hypothetical protein
MKKRISKGTADSHGLFKNRSLISRTFSIMLQLIEIEGKSGKGIPSSQNTAIGTQGSLSPFIISGRLE